MGLIWGISFGFSKSSTLDLQQLQELFYRLEVKNLLETRAFWKCVTLFNAICWGATYICTKAGIDALVEAEVPQAAAVFQFIRFGLCALLMLPWLFKSSSRRSTWCSCKVGLLNALAYLSVSVAYAIGTTGSKAAFMASLQAIVVTACSCLAAGKWQMSTACSAFLAVLGVAILELKGPLEANAGDLVCLGCPLFLGLGWYALGGAMKDHPADAIPSVAIQFVVFALVFGSWLFVNIVHSDGPDGFVAFLIELPAILKTPNLLAPLFFCVVFGSMASMFLANRAMQFLSSSSVSLIVASEPLWAAVTAVLCLGEVLAFGDYLGGALIMAALLCNELWESPGDEKLLKEKHLVCVADAVL